MLRQLGLLLEITLFADDLMLSRSKISLDTNAFYVCYKFNVVFCQIQTMECVQT